ncbi:hypothetical protein QGN32_15975 [Mycolicibacterium sp. ND9-15]|uniref:hypothetical protein n=1 Tax=Mycolicibacterium sp. ND9-15 TaxID=3042320 RepID=UPI002DDA0670|nr:hypothetical protein [Mycolicibacterium sp. ND9-15]WSE54960.1 hypothetical protein QGN32_15975 [Mycolicibacterium sp. ND9-15]
MASALDRKRCWTIAEHRGEDTLGGSQHLVARASWDVDDLRDDLVDDVVDASRDPAKFWSSTRPARSRRCPQRRTQRQLSGAAGRIENSP